MGGDGGDDRSQHEHRDRDHCRRQYLRLAASSQRQQPQGRVQHRDDGEVDSVSDRNGAIEPEHAVKAVRHRQDDDREQEDQVEKHLAAAAFRRNRQPPVMAEPEQASDDEADHQRDQRLRIGVEQVDPVRRRREPARLRQVVCQQGHRHTEDGVTEHFEAAHFEAAGVFQGGFFAVRSHLATIARQV